MQAVKRRQDGFDVVVAGAGPVGTMLACELGEHGVSTLVLDERAELSGHPRANTHASRSLEYYRRLGLSGRLRDGGLPPGRPTDAAYFTRLSGHELGRVSLPAPRDAVAACRADDPRWPTPEPQLRASQLVLEPLLLERARSYPSVELRHGWRVTEAGQDGDGAFVVAEEQGQAPVRIACRYLVGCDGGRSVVRRAAGIRYAGEGGLDLDFFGGRMMATYFRAPGLLDTVPAAPAWQYWSLNPDRRSLIVAIDGRETFLLHTQLREGETPDAFDFGACLRQALGTEVAYEVLSAAPWRAGQALVAERFRAGRLFIAGDAAHLFTPTGGFGVNTGIEDAVNLAWKLAAACQGWGGDALLDTYEAERHAAAVRNTAAALSLAQAVGACPVAATIEDDTLQGAQARRDAAAHIARFARDEYDTPGVQLGTRYDGSSAVVAESGAEVPDDLPTRYVPCAVPGGRTPHLWLPDGRSLLDLLGHRFTLLRFGGAIGGEALEREAASRGVPFGAVSVPGDAAHQLYRRRFVLVRPDGVIAWRGDALPQAGALLDQVTVHCNTGRCNTGRREPLALSA